ncbi:hypothetical protein [Nocardioides alcanivorans]|uniref:hypothetical protein n=1 Tax=Nocardioides alcanivorans TaxID=2897352 RepID=UPI001F1B4A93|nr:hypothetical protein [Nocardioides alcanivorans]
MRGIFFDEDTARIVELELRRAGWAARVEPERLAGEDDDEDHQWAVVTDAPPVQFELLVDAHEGWLEEDLVAPAEVAPLQLPDAPKRIKRLDP